GGLQGIADVWYSFVAPASGQVKITADEVSAIRIRMAVYSGTCGGLIEKGCTLTNNSSSLNLTGLIAGNTYFLQLWNTSGIEEGTFDVTLTDPNPILPPPSNDNLENAEALTCGALVTGSTAFATLDNHNTAPDAFGVDLDAPSVWFSYNSAILGANKVTLNLCESGYNTSVMVFTGTPGNLILVGGNNDASSCGNRSIASFNTNGTDTYFIAVEGQNIDDKGAFDMTVTCDPIASPVQDNQDCTSAIPLPVNGTATTVDNTNATLNSVQPSCGGLQGIADVWYSFVAPASGQVNITSQLGTELGNALRVRMAVYSGTCVALIDEGCTRDPALNIAGLISGDIYFLQLWNTSGIEEGTFDITLTDPGTLGTEDTPTKNIFAHYPNPVSNALSLKAQKPIQNVSVYNLLGLQVLQTRPNMVKGELDMAPLQTGTYFVKVTVEGGATQTVKVVKK
ncbi:MAG TPA: T9SS type A sorting domain-containing protein, partial [Mariniflexile sp.]